MDPPSNHRLDTGSSSTRAQVSYAALRTSADPLEWLSSVVEFELFRVPSSQALRRSAGSKGGWPPIYPVLLFRILILQAPYGLPDQQAEFQIRDRLSFMRLLGLGPADRVPDYVCGPEMWCDGSSLNRSGSFAQAWQMNS